MQLLPWLNKRRLCVIFALALVLALFLELGIFMRQTEFVFAGEYVSLTDGVSSNMTTYGYHVVGDQYNQADIDPQIVFSNVNRKISTVLITFRERIYSTVNVEVFYQVEGQGFSEANSTDVEKIAFAANSIILEIPLDYYDALRVDINGMFSLADVFVSDQPIVLSNPVVEPFSITRFVLVYAVLVLMLLLVFRWVFTEKNERNLTVGELAFCLACFVYYFNWAVAQPYNYGPDEAMRYDVTWFLFVNDRLPVGAELLSPWGFSYAHLPTVLCNQLGYVFMKAVSLFSNGEFTLLLAARMVSVCCGVGSVYFTIKIAKQMFQSPARWVMIVMVAFMPQFAFLSSYVNNDIVAFLGICMIMYSWVLGMKYNWSFRSAVLLSVGISTCGLSYYNSYAWVLLSVFFFFITYFYQNKRDFKGVARMTGVIVCVTVLLIGYSFIRHVVLYGDLLGFNTTNYYGELFAIDSLKPSNRLSFMEKGISFSEMMYEIPYTWIETTWKSAVGIFGPMAYRCSDDVYALVGWLFAIGGLGLLVKVAYNFVIRRKPGACTVVFWLCALLSALVTIALSIYNSYCIDFQPQGRYCYPAMLAVIFFVAKGYEGIIGIIKKDVHQYAVIAMMCTTFVLLALDVYNTVYLPS